MRVGVTAPLEEARRLAALAALRKGEAALALQERSRLPDSSSGRAWRLAFDAHLHAAGVAGSAPPEMAAMFANAREAPLPTALAVHQRLIGGVLALDRGVAEPAIAMSRELRHEVSDHETKLRLELAEHWFRVLAGGDDASELSAIEDAAREHRVGDLVVEAAALRALTLAESGALTDAITHARRASRMARTEGLPQQEYLANLALARLRRMSGRPYLATHILSALVGFVSPIWRPWLAWEMVLAAGQSVAPLDESTTLDFSAMLSAAVSGQALVVARAYERSLERIRGAGFAERDLKSARATFDIDFDGADDSELARWRSGRVDDLPHGLMGLARRSDAEHPRVHVVTGPGRRARRALRLGLVSLVGCEVDLEPLQRKESRTDATLAALCLAGEGGESDAELFEKVWGFRFSADRHRDVLDMAVSRARARLGSAGEIRRSHGRLTLQPHVTISVPDPRGSTVADDRVLWLLAQRGGASATQAAAALGVPLRTVQASLKVLVDEGLCVSERQGRSTEYRVEDTTFQEPTRPGTR